jgi:hypothetical protein
MKTYKGSGFIVPRILTSALDEGEWLVSGPSRLNPSTHWTGGWVGPRAGLDDVEKRNFLTLPGLQGHAVA